MADDLPDAPWVTKQQDLPDAPWTQTGPFPVSSDAGSSARSWLPSITENLNPFSESNVREAEHPSLLPTGPLKGIGAVAGYLTSPLADLSKGAAHAVAAPVEAGVKWLADRNPGTWLSPSPEVQAKANADLEAGLETAPSLVMPGRGGVPMPARPTTGPFGVTETAGEAAGNLGMRQAEQNAIRAGDPHAQAFVAQRQAQLEAAKDHIAAGFDPFGQQIAGTAQEAGGLTQEALQRAAKARKADVDTLYAQARAQPGEIDADVLRSMPQDIKADLTTSKQPVIINDMRTPNAAAMIDHIENRVGQLQIQNRASPLGQPNQQSIVGVNLEGIDELRKDLSTLRGDAFASRNPTDIRASRAVMDAFDARIDQAVNGGHFSGSPDAIQAWNDARAAHADYRSTFFGGKNDPAGQEVAKIIGKYDPNNPMSVDDVAKYFTGGGNASKGINTANRVKSILGEQSPEWSGIKQGVFRNLVETPQGVTDYGTGQIANRLGKFVNSDLAKAIYTPQELRTLQAFADFNRRITMPPGSYFPSAPAINKVIGAVGSQVGKVIGGVIGHFAIPIPFVGAAVGYGAAEGIGAATQGIKAAQLNKQLPLVADQMQRWQKAVVKATRANAPPNQFQAVMAAKGLQNALSKLRIDFRPIIAAAMGNKEDQQNQTLPPLQKKYGGAVGKQPRFAKGGHVVAKHHPDFNPEHIGAKRAKNGHWYIKDPKRPGKWLIVLPKKGRAAGVVH
jgi:hypothetical protein